MLRVNLDDGHTLAFDLGDPSEVARWREHVADPDFHARVRGLQLLRKEGGRVTGRAALPRPPGVASWDAELVLDRDRPACVRAVVCVPPVRVILSLFLTSGPVSSRVDVERVGRLVLPAPQCSG